MNYNYGFLKDLPELNFHNPSNILSPCNRDANFKISTGSYDLGYNPSVVLYPKCSKNENKCVIGMMEVHEGLKNKTYSNTTDLNACGQTNFYDSLVLDGFRLPKIKQKEKFNF